MATSVCFKREINGDLDSVIERVTGALKNEGFGVLTRIDLHSKIREKLAKEIRPTVILGACNPQLAFDAYQRNTDVASLLPCNAVIREIESGRVSVELAKPSAMMEMLGDRMLVELARNADAKLQTALEKV